MFQIGLEMKAIKPGPDRPLEEIPYVSARERLLDPGLGPLAEQGRPQRQPSVDRVVIEAGQVEHRVDQLGVKVGGGPAGFGGSAGPIPAPRANDRSESPRCEIRPMMPSKSARALVQYRACPVSRPTSARNRAIQNVAWLETSCEPLPAPLQPDPAGSYDRVGPGHWDRPCAPRARAGLLPPSASTAGPRPAAARTAPPATSAVMSSVGECSTRKSGSSVQSPRSFDSLRAVEESARLRVEEPRALVPAGGDASAGSPRSRSGRRRHSSALSIRRGPASRPAERRPAAPPRRTRSNRGTRRNAGRGCRPS